jgi:predicted O-linked N-acetylglucosamine transferase (SPINDLY family)
MTNDKDDVGELTQLGIEQQQSGRLDEAIAAYRRAAGLWPGNAVAQYNLGSALALAGALAEASAALQRAAELRPDDPEVHNNRGGVLQRMGRTEEAVAAYRRAIALKADHGAAWSNLGSALCALGRLEEAIVVLDRAVALAPAHARAHANRGAALHAAGRLDEAIAALGRALALEPRGIAAHANLGRALHDADRIDEAEAVLLRALGIDPGCAEVHMNLGNVQKDQARIAEAVRSYERALELEPGHAAAASHRLFALHLDPDRDAETLRTECRRWADRFAAPLAAEIRPQTLSPWERVPEGRVRAGAQPSAMASSTPAEGQRATTGLGRRLCIGFVSADFRSHPVGRLLLPLFVHRDRDRYEFHAYSDVRAVDAVTRQFADLADAWHTIAGRSDAEVARRIRDDGIDILIDLAQHTAGNRLLVFARKPAPVQVSMLGMPAATGLATIDYRLTDGCLEPAGTGTADQDEADIERPLRLPHGFWCYPPVHDAPPVGELPALSARTITFGCLNQSAKLSRPALELWIKILESVDGARLLLQVSSAWQRDRIHAMFRAGGIAPERIAFARRVPLLTYLASYHAVDVGLDPFPYSGGTTTMDALWMGVPVITLAGRTAVGRGGVSILTNVGLPELIAGTPDEYIAIARALAGDPGRLAELRRGLRGRMAASPLLDGRQYAADLEAAFRRMWQTLADPNNR